ncbi:MAG: D-hexose-6-phosphate mutarotase [Casimicrobiaceae bacterium]|nr:D-hexose-6-phosphate mutarotase [Casimicrobiaceae bacterium]MCX8098280.1 D-hexose-6-phosphate mutarotase [Casimicrobiaceae bacterium]MDW8311783.1 D-hexose-6-phosphate mutarotase [Burkholderiales bacterium]
MNSGHRDSRVDPIRYGRYGDLPVILVRTSTASAAVSLFGGQVLSYAPQGQSDLLWVSPTTATPPRPLRGGIPICWPYFARQGQPEDAPQHGLVRTEHWRFLSARVEPDARVVMALAAPALPGVGLDLVLTLSIGSSLGMALTTVNVGRAPVRMTQAFHTYFRVGDARRCSIEELAGLTYSDKFDGFARHVQHGPWTLADPRDPGRSDRIYHDAGGAYRVNDPTFGRVIEVVSSGSRSVVVWNPGAEAVRGFADIPHEAWPHFLCLEVANCGDDVVELAPGETHVLRQTLTAQATAGGSAPACSSMAQPFGQRD